MTALKGAVRDLFYNLLAALWNVSNTHAQVAKAQSCANQVQYTDRYHLQRVVYHLVRRDSSAIKFDRV